MMIPRSKKMDTSSSKSMPLIMASATAMKSSAPISVPSSHIHRTPSELQLRKLTLRAEEEDARMYSRLLCGMYDQISCRYFASGGYVHPLSKKSFQGVINTKQAKDQDLEHREQYPNSEDIDDDDGWSVSYTPVQEDIDNDNMVSFSSSATITRDSCLSLNHDACIGEREHEQVCVFDMDM
mmetsp:Transcript_24263/g.50837  ORF Transcript_24263/g.50837 Transcript_24263/m.50837 type:complete len:181 (-) Transcript_24263:131-673(-)